MDNKMIETVSQQKSERVSFFEVFSKSIGFFISITFIYLVVFIAFKGRNDNYYNQLLKNSQTQNIPSVTKSDYSGSKPVQNNNDSHAVDSDDSNKNAPIVVDINNMPKSVAEIVAYYNAAHAKVRNNANSVTKTYSNVTNYNDVLETGNSKVLPKIGKSIMSNYLKEDTNPVNFEGSQAVKENFPPANNDSNLTENDVLSSTCVDKGTFYELEIHLKPENDPSLGKGTGSVFTIITKQEINDAVAGYIEVSDVACRYEDVYVIAQVDKQTGNMTYEYIHAPFFLNLTALNMKCRIGLLFEEKWQINW